MDVRSPLFQNIALIVAGVLFLNPIVATAASTMACTAAGSDTSPAVAQAMPPVAVISAATRLAASGSVQRKRGDGAPSPLFSCPTKETEPCKV